MAGGRLWTTREDNKLRKHVERKGRGNHYDWEKLTAALPRRTKSAIHNRMEALGLEGAGAWSAEEVEYLSREWGEVGQRTLMKNLPRRAWGAIYQKARKLGLGVATQGLMPLKHAALKAGMSFIPFRSVMERMEVRIRRHLTPSPDMGAVPSRHVFVDWSDAEVAVKRWLAMERLTDAARRLRLDRCTLGRHTVRAGYALRVHKSHLRLPPETWDAIAVPILSRRARANVARCGTKVQEAAPRTSAETTTDCVLPEALAACTRTASPRTGCVNRRV